MNKGHKTGVWEYYGYTPSGEKVVVQRYDYDAGRLLYFRPGPDVTCHAELSPGQWSYVCPDQPPLFIGSDAALAEYTRRLVYPAEAVSRNIQGKVVVAFVIDTLGQTSNYHLVQRIGGGCDEEALRVARTLPAQWVPARLGSRAVAVEYELPLNFRLAQP
ncbi:energy transducer TonB [Hymenobacter psoromatis]|uniref:energy transducer TonB n=1 Tax=Hymenobacter psoromatis TaxID=1484116 RepID=UPI001CBC855A|nr:energy transducer TonB [Hymenobacter psoromatis]